MKRKIKEKRGNEKKKEGRKDIKRLGNKKIKKIKKCKNIYNRNRKKNMFDPEAALSRDRELSAGLPRSQDFYCFVISNCQWDYFMGRLSCTPKLSCVGIIIDSI